MNWRFTALGHTVDVVSEVSQLNQRLQALLGCYRPIANCAEPCSSYRLSETGGRAQLLYNGEARYDSESREDLIDYFQLDMYRRIVAQVQDGWLLHAAALARGKNVIVLAGPSDAGKSTLCRGLMADGWDYLTEEMVSLGEDGVDALRRPLHLESPEQVAGISDIATPIRMREEPASWIACAPDRSTPQRMDELRVAAILRIQFFPGGKTLLRPLASSAALEQLWECRMNSGLDIAKLACRIVATTSCYRLDSHDLTSAMRAISQIDLE